MTRTDNPLNLHGRKLEIWQGRSGLPVEREEAYRQLWLKMQAEGKPVVPPAREWIDQVQQCPQRVKLTEVSGCGCQYECKILARPVTVAECLQCQKNGGNAQL